MIWNGKKMLFNSGASLPFASNSGVEVDKSAIISPVQIEDEGKGDYNFSFGAIIKGSESLDFVPVGKTTTVQLTSKWQSPSFDGSFLPNTRIISANGFSSSWKILHLNRDFPQQWVKVTPESLNKSVFGVKLITPNDSYQKTSRSIKYAILVISLTFLAFFFVEILNYKRLHLFNYILVGLALCIFYTLLLSISEVLNFNQAYLIASSMTLGLVFFYSKSIFQNVRLAMIVSLVMAVLYGFIFIIIQLDDTALLIGSIGLFLILAITMYISRKINWNQIGLEKNLV